MRRIINKKLLELKEFINRILKNNVARYSLLATLAILLFISGILFDHYFLVKNKEENKDNVTIVDNHSSKSVLLTIKSADLKNITGVTSQGVEYKFLVADDLRIGGSRVISQDVLAGFVDKKVTVTYSLDSNGNKVATRISNTSE